MQNTHAATPEKGKNWNKLGFKFDFYTDLEANVLEQVLRFIKGITGYQTKVPADVRILQRRRNSWHMKPDNIKESFFPSMN